jgi:hypothetical protein
MKHEASIKQVPHAGKLTARGHLSFILHAWWERSATPEISSPQHCGDNEADKITDRFSALILPVGESSDNGDWRLLE